MRSSRGAVDPPPVEKLRWRGIRVPELVCSNTRSGMRGASPAPQQILLRKSVVPAALPYLL
ncbi:hypothetical protein [Streptomyces parvus]|uniref:hypothetical protein n=1 Tax=Streptomyces parvus TaxID=66428 RepID=UPI0021009EBE|nr:hypothetical protein [Streptomyces parvus]MCQ1581808.1 hypothetical protein [Streptomyces parvus]